ncbi:MAG: FAD-dependent oxidoreductase [Candidatus Pelagadaptatus aseana]|uniref:FAD-dependent oxidoreductase n=1 Tax=Candidatus Pelagadaptatus aseana TaxID=3120508 RepID=UPI0039B16045
MTQSNHTVQLDIAIIGGGIAGLWLLNRLKHEGYDCALFEDKALGSDQSVGSQGMIHGGIKYTLSGALTGASEAIADMPEHWRKCVQGEGDVDISGARILSDHFYMWSSASVTSKLTTFFASKATRGRVDKVAASDRPAALQNPAFSGQLYKLVDMVLDVPSVVQTLASNAHGQTFLLPADQQHWHRDNAGHCQLQFNHQGVRVNVSAKQFIFTAGKGNGQILEQLQAQKPQMQIRPLQQVMVKHDYPHPFYGHCLGADKTPRLTISSHQAQDGKWVWYLGGSLAEKGVKQTPQQLIQAAKSELATLMPWIDLSNAQWAALAIDRAEPRQKNLVRPDKAFIGALDSVDNACVAWPTKLSLAPNLATETADMLKSKGITPSGSNGVETLAQWIPQAPVAPCPWDVPGIWS